MDMETLKVFQDSITAENTEIIAGYNKAKNSKDNIDAKIVEEVSSDSPEEILAS